MNDNSLTVVSAVEAALVQNDLSKLTVEQRISYYNRLCESLSLNPLTQPFSYINLSGKLTLYAKKDATEQLRKIRKVSITGLNSETIEGVYVVTAQAQDGEGRSDMSKGAVNIAGLKGDALANALMKAETKAKRRVTLSICGLGLLDETELETIKDAQIVVEPAPLKALPAAVKPADEIPQPKPKVAGPHYYDISNVYGDKLAAIHSWLAGHDVEEAAPGLIVSLAELPKLKNYAVDAVKAAQIVDAAKRQEQQQEATQEAFGDDDIPGFEEEGTIGPDDAAAKIAAIKARHAKKIQQRGGEAA